MHGEGGAVEDMVREAQWKRRRGRRSERRRGNTVERRHLHQRDHAQALLTLLPLLGVPGARARPLPVRNPAMAQRACVLLRLPRGAPWGA